MKLLEKMMSDKFDEVYSFRQRLSEESDRGCALMAAAYLDEELKKLLQKSFVNDKKIYNEILDHSAPLGSFSARIDLAYLLGLISKKSRRDLHLIRKVRNAFGHSSQKLTFADRAIAARCKELYHVGVDTAKPRAKFSRVVMGVLAIIHSQIYLLKPIKAREEVDMTKWKKAFEEVARSVLEPEVINKLIKPN